MDFGKGNAPLALRAKNGFANGEVYAALPGFSKYAVLRGLMLAAFRDVGWSLGRPFARPN
jgi:hypothetical protein